MKQRILLVALLVLGTMFLRGDGCIMKDTDVELVILVETCAEFQQNEDTATFANPAIVAFDADLDGALADAGYDRGDIVEARVVAGYYGALSNDSNHDWEISGSITVQRLPAGVATTAMNYASQSVNGALGKKIKAPLEADAVDLINQAVADYLAGQQGIQLQFVIDNGAMTPAPSVLDPAVFEWKGWVELHVVFSESVELPDPF